jgi:hypothetical protein
LAQGAAFLCMCFLSPQSTLPCRGTRHDENAAIR